MTVVTATSTRTGLGIRGKLLLWLAGIIGAGLLIFAVIIFIVLGGVADRIQSESLEKSVYAVTVPLSLQLYGEDIVTMVESSDSSDSAGTDVHDVLQTAFTLDPNVGRVYTAVRDPDAPEELLFVTVYSFDADGTPTRHDELFLTPYEPLEFDAQYAAEDAYIFEAFDGFDVIAPQDHIDEEGFIWLNGFAPVYDDAGEVVALVGVDISGDQLDFVQGTVLLLIGVSLAVVLLPLLVAIYLISGALVRPIAAIRDAALVVEDEMRDFDEAMLLGVSTRHDELGDLARIFSQMALEVEKRVDTLKAEVAQLKIEIDQSKRQQDVEDIRGSDYYQKLRTKAQEYRQSQDEEASGKRQEDAPS